MLVEDEPENPSHRVVLNANGGLQALDNVRIIGQGLTPNDLEGISYAGKYVYAITSRSTNKKGEPRRDRAVLARFKYQNGRLFQAPIIQGFKQVIGLRLWPEISNLSVNKILEEINIEALVLGPTYKEFIDWFSLTALR